MSLNESIANIRVELQKANLKKSGKNKFAGFDYFELADFLPKLNELMQKEKVNDLFTIDDGKATLTLIQSDEKQVYTIPFILFETPKTYKKSKSGEYVKNKDGEYVLIPSMQDIQYLGALNTYYKRYLYLNAFGITDGDVIDAMDNSEETKSNPDVKKDEPIKATPKQIAKVKELVTDIEGMLKYYKIDKIDDLTIEQASKIIAKKGKK